MSVSDYSPRTALVYLGLSTDPKPSPVEAGARFLELDTQHVFIWNDATWTQITAVNVTVVI